MKLLRGENSSIITTVVDGYINQAVMEAVVVSDREKRTVAIAAPADGWGAAAMMEGIRTGLIGYGFAGRCFHAPVIDSVPGLQLTHVVERSGGGASAERCPWAKVVWDAGALADDPDLELVVIATPGGTHYELAKAMLLAGKHVVVDKPFTAASAEADELIDLARRQNKLLGGFTTVAGTAIS